MPNNGMDEAGDKMATNRGNATPKKRSKKAGPFLKVKAGSAVVPIYRAESNGRVRFTLLLSSPVILVDTCFIEILDSATASNSLQRESALAPR